MTPTPQQIKDQLLQAIDKDANIRNMVAVLEVISSLEKYPITKEALEETRLGKLINDVRKKTKNEELAKRAKKLLRSWQKLLVEPVGQIESVPRALPTSPGSANGGAHAFKLDLPSLATSTGAGGGKPALDLKSKNDVHNSFSLLADKQGNRKRKGELRDGTKGPPSKVPKANEQLQNSTPPPSNGIRGSPENFPSPPDMTSTTIHTIPGKSRPEHQTPYENDKHSKIPVNAVKPHTSSPGLVRNPSTSSLLKTAILQQHGKTDDTGVRYRPSSPRCQSFSPRTLKHETTWKPSMTYAPKGSVSSPSQSFTGTPAQEISDSEKTTSHLPKNNVQVPSPVPALQLATTPPQPTQAKGLHPPETEHQFDRLGNVSNLETVGENQVQHHSSTTLQQQDSPYPPLSPNSSVSHLGESLHSHELDAAMGELSSSECASFGCDSKKSSKKKYRSRDYQVNLDGQVIDESVKPVRLKERRITFDPATGQIKPLTHKDSSQAESPVLPEPHRTTEIVQEQRVNLQSTLDQTNWKELSKNEIIQSYLSRQSCLLSSSGVQPPGGHIVEFLQHESHRYSTSTEVREVHILVPTDSPSELPGVTREIRDSDVHRIHQQHWAGVNGCMDNHGKWYDWTQGISLDPHGDQGQLHILPYVCLD
ncbi:mediator of RNA polymerase II transcription subunit 26 isoform X1 [Chiloscyllium plagiosum]|uniref:mediator of RNA polymerase II transcription subunit 26 isoform X1 n=1 Tax=Chiloscyllium plagiosum TaxID=36176 RepID=UPI001CB85F22|nr:mediator of RNA polymerase II transcription subunit 26 isoform X1 [Chiloscyllium plagiosum]